LGDILKVQKQLIGAAVRACRSTPGDLWAAPPPAKACMRRSRAGHGCSSAAQLGWGGPGPGVAGMVVHGGGVAAPSNPLPHGPRPVQSVASVRCLPSLDRSVFSLVGWPLPPPGANAAMAGKPGNRRIQLAIQGGAFGIHRQFFRHIAQKRCGIDGTEQGRQAARARRHQVAAR
jgi:hypothetical protein